MRAAIYARYSSENQQETSIEDQLRNCRKLIDERGWTLSKVYCDRALSGATVLRPDYQSLLADAREGKFEVVVAEGLDRLSRDTEATAALYKKMSFLGIAIVTLAEGEVTELHAGLKGMMNALALKDLAIKTHRGIEGRVRKGLSGGGRVYGYRLIKQRDANGDLMPGLREIEPFQAEIVRRIFREFAAGKSPRAIARGLNADAVPSPTGKGWRDTTIRGHASRKTGILRNSIYIGRPLWNKQTYIRDPVSGKRLARVRKQEEIIAVEVPHLGFIDQPLWNHVQIRLQASRDAVGVSKAGKSEFWKSRRPKHPFTGLIVCACCGGSLQAAGKDYLVCAAARNGLACDNRRSVRRHPIEEAVLEGLKSHLMAPDLVQEFIGAFHDELNRGHAASDSEREGRVQELARLSKKVQGLYDAIADGLRTPGLQGELLALEQRVGQLREGLEKEPPPAPRFHPKLAERYRELVDQLHTSLNDPNTRSEAADILRKLVTKIEVRSEGAQTLITLSGDIVNLLALSGEKVPASFESSVSDPRHR